MHEQPLRWWLRPVRKVERVGEQSAVVCHWEYIRPRSASFWSVGMLMAPPKGDHAARPVSSYRTIRALGDPWGALASVKGPQSGLESRTSSLTTPLNGFFGMTCLQVTRAVFYGSANGKGSPLPRELAVRPWIEVERRLIRASRGSDPQTFRKGESALLTTASLERHVAAHVSSPSAPGVGVRKPAGHLCNACVPVYSRPRKLSRRSLSSVPIKEPHETVSERSQRLFRPGVRVGAPVEEKVRRK